MCSCMGVFRHADVVCVHPVAVLNAAFCMTCSLLMLVEDARGDHMEESYCLVCSHECLLLFAPCYCGECLYYF